MRSIQRPTNCFKGQSCVSRTAFVVFAVLGVLSTTTTVGAQDGDQIVVEADPFLLRMAPKPEDFSLQMKVTVLWTVENIVRQYFEDLYRDSDETLFIGAGITGLSVVDEAVEEYETIKFLGGAVAFHPSSKSTPNRTEIQASIMDSLKESVVVEKLGIYFPSVSKVDYIPLSIGNRGFGYGQSTLEELEPPNIGASQEEPTEKPPVTKPSPEVEPADGRDETYTDPSGVQINAIESQENSLSASNASKTTIGLSAGVALGGAIIVLLIALLLESRRRRMKNWRDSARGNPSDLSLEGDRAKKNKPSTGARYYVEDDQEASIRLPRIWGVSPSQPMDSGTSGSSDLSASNEENSVQDILTCTSMDRRGIQNVESFEHQKRLVDTLKKEMMASNAEFHPYMQATHLDNTEPCALSPTDLSAAALQKNATSRAVPTWFPPSESSFTASANGSGNDSPSSSLRAMMRALSLSSMMSSSTSRSHRSPYEPESAEL
jgi:hypothetical protein